MAYQDLRMKSSSAGVRVLRMLAAILLVWMGFTAYQTHLNLKVKRERILEAKQELRRLDAEMQNLTQWIEDVKSNPEFQKIVVREFYPAVSADETLYAVPAR